MAFKDFICIVFVSSIVLVVDGAYYGHYGLVSKVRKSDSTCYNVTKEPHFENAMVVGKPWRIYFGWNMKLDDVCMDISIKYASALLVQRMKQYMIKSEVQPPWANAALFMTVGRQTRGILLFNDLSNIPGQFVGLPTVKRDWNEEREEKPEIYHMTMKVLHRGSYLLFSDCKSGVTSLSVHHTKRPKRARIEAVAAQLDFGDPFPACTEEPDLEDMENTTIS